MSWRTSQIACTARRAGRSLGLNRFVALSVGRDRYEDKFRKAMAECVCPGDIVWDVGANEGLYSAELSKMTGAEGQVVAWEPSPANLARLRGAVAGLPNVVVMPMALGQVEGAKPLRRGLDEKGASSRIVDDESESAQPIDRVHVAVGDALKAAGRVPGPNVVKIDTEGYELDVLRGLNHWLGSPTLRAACVEVHFGILSERGLNRAPADIECLLRDAGLSVSWPDASHIVATRKT